MATPPSTSAPSRSRLIPGRSRDPERPPHQRRRRTRRILASEGVFDSIVSLAGLLGRPVRNQTGQEIGRLDDVVARWADGQVYPPVSGLVIRVGRRLAFVPASAIDRIGHAEVVLRSARLDLRDVIRRSGEVLLAKDVLDHQLVDVEGVQVIRAADLYLAEVIGRIRLVGADVSNATLLRRLGPRRWRPRPTPDRVIDWAAIQPFTESAKDVSGAATHVRLKMTNEGLHRLRPGELADLLEDLRRDERRELLAALGPDEAADALEEMQPEDLEQLLRESDPVEAARLLAAMEPDEAVDALRDLPLAVRGEVLRHIPAVTALALRELLGYDEDEAGGIMTTALVTAKSGREGQEGRRPALRGPHPWCRPRCGGRRRQRRPAPRRRHGARHPVCHADVHRHAHVGAPRRRGRGDGEPARVGWRGGGAIGRSPAAFHGGDRRRRMPDRADPGRRRARCPGAHEGSVPLPPPSVMSVKVSRRWLIYLAAAGPGLIAAAAGNDAGGIVTYSSAGAQFVYRTLFLMVLITIAYVIVQEMVARLAVHTGKGLAALIREEFDLRLTAFAITAFAIANIGLMVTEFGGIATSFELFNVSRYISVPIAAVAIWSLVLFGSYRYAERVFLLLTLVFIAYPIAAVLAHPNWHEVAANTVWPHFVASKSFLLLSVALIGTTITPYIQLYEAGAVVDKGVKPEQYHFQRVDAITGAVLAALVAMSIIIATGATIGGTGPLTSASTAAEGLKPVAGAFATTLFGIGLLGASALAAAVVPLSTSYAVAEAIGVERSVSSSFRQAPVFLGIFTFQILIGAAVVLVPGNLITLILNTQVLEGVITPMTLILILVLANRRSLLGSAANGPFARWVGGTGHCGGRRRGRRLCPAHGARLGGYRLNGRPDGARNPPFAHDQGVRGG